MPLTLVTGPANAGRRARPGRGARPPWRTSRLLVVPAVDDVSRRTSASWPGARHGVRPAVDGCSTAWRRWRTGGPAAERARPDAARRSSAAAVAGAQLRALGARGRIRPGVRHRPLGELSRSSSGSSSTPHVRRRCGRRGRHGRRLRREVATLYAAYRDLLDRRGPGRRRPARLARARRPAGGTRAWGRHPVFVYGFDDLTRLQREGGDAGRARGRRCDGRADLGASARLWPGGHPLPGARTRADRHEVLQARSELLRESRHCTTSSAGCSRTTVEPDRPERSGAAAGGGRRARRGRAGRRRGGRPDRGAGRLPSRSPSSTASPREPGGLVRSVFEDYGIPVAVAAPVPLRAIPLGRGLLGLLRAAFGEGRAQDVLAWLRTPGVLARPGLADQLEAAVRGGRRDDGGGGAPSCGRPSAGRSTRSTAWGRPTARACWSAVARAAEQLLAAPRKRAAAVLDERSVSTPPRCGPCWTCSRGLTALRARTRRLPPRRQSCSTPSSASRFARGTRPAASRSLDPLAIRARRVRALFACGLQEAEFPRPARPEPFLSDELRRELAEATGPDACPSATTCSRTSAPSSTRSPPDPRRCSACRYRTSDEEGRPAVRSFFVDDVRDLFTERLHSERAHPAARRRHVVGRGGSDRRASGPAPRRPAWTSSRRESRR